MIVLLAVSALIAAGVLYQAVGARRDNRRHPARGRLVDAGCVLLHLNEQGAGSPAVVLESGIAATSLSWALVQPKIAELTRVCSYDRAGLGWSGECSLPRNVEQIVSELSAALQRASIPPPYILVGHSFGGLVIRAYAHLKPEEVSALLFLDPVSLQYWSNYEAEGSHRLERAAQLSRRGALLARLGIVRLALWALAGGARRFPKLVARAAAGEGTKVMEGLAGEIRRLPPEVWPDVRAHWSRPKCFRAMARYLESLPDNARAAIAMPLPRYLPFTILSASNATGAELRERDSWVHQSDCGQHIRVEKCGHWVQLERPELVVDAVRKLLEICSAKQTPLNSL